MNGWLPYTYFDLQNSDLGGHHDPLNKHWKGHTVRAFSQFRQFIRNWHWTSFINLYLLLNLCTVQWLLSFTDICRSVINEQVHRNCQILHNGKIINTQCMKKCINYKTILTKLIHRMCKLCSFHIEHLEMSRSQ